MVGVLEGRASVPVNCRKDRTYPLVRLRPRYYRLRIRDAVPKIAATAAYCNGPAARNIHPALISLGLGIQRKSGTSSFQTIAPGKPCNLSLK
jgi:hypothetical protein